MSDPQDDPTIPTPPTSTDDGSPPEDGSPLTSSSSGSSASSSLIIPADVQEKFAALVTLIQASESMNDEERQYWIDILPIMTQEQVEQLRTILQNERDQLAAIDAKYRAQIEQSSTTTAAPMDEKTRSEKRKSMQTEEASDQEKERAREEELLKHIADL